MPLVNRTNVRTKTGSVQSNNTRPTLPDVSVETPYSKPTFVKTGDDEDDNYTTSSMRSEENPIERHTLFLSSSTVPDKNEDWGDMMETKQQNCLRIYYQNINGLKYNESWDKCKQTIDMLHTNEIDIAGFTETNINWNHQRTQYVRTLLRQRNRNSLLITSSSDEQTKQSYQPGGTSMILQNNVLGTIDKHDSDKRGLGRWTYCIIQGKNNKKVAFITAYRVSQNSVTGDETAYAQQYRLLRRQNIMNPKPKKVFDDDLCQLLTA